MKKDDCFYLSVNTSSDTRMREALRKHGVIARVVFSELLARYFRDTETFVVNEGVYRDIADRIFGEAEQVKRAAEGLVEAGLFDAEEFKQGRLVQIGKILAYAELPEETEEEEE